MFDWTLIITAGIAALATLGGVIFGSFKPILDWDIEKRREKFKTRKVLVTGWRNTVLDCLKSGKKFVKTPAYISLRPHMKQNELEAVEIEKRGIVIHVGKAGLAADDELRTINDAVDRIAKKWGVE